MKKIIITLLTLISLNALKTQSFAKGVCWTTWQIGNNLYSGNGRTIVDTSFNQGDTINIQVLISDECSRGCSSILYNTTWSHGTNSYSGQILSFTASDTGTYYSSSSWLVIGGDCLTIYSRLELHIGYKPLTSISEIVNPNVLQLFPSLSKGLFQIRNNGHQQIKKIMIMDSMGKIVFSSYSPLSEIDLTSSNTGIYFYAIEDDKDKFSFGKIIKE